MSVLFVNGEDLDDVTVRSWRILGSVGMHWDSRESPEIKRLSMDFSHESFFLDLFYFRLVLFLFFFGFV